MKFSKEQFKKNADKYTQRLLSEHINSLDGQVVEFSEGDIFGTCCYTHEEEDFGLYPVRRDWCDEEQLSLLVEVTNEQM